MNQAVDALAERAIREHWEFLPTSGSRIGRHEYDGRLPDFSAGRVRRRIEELHQSLAQLSSLPADDDGAVGANDDDARMDRLSRSLLEVFLRRELFNLEEMRTLRNNPQRQVGYLGVGSYVQRDYAPLPERLRAATAVLRQAPDFLATLDGLTEPELGEPIRDMAVEAYRGMASFYRTGLAAASAECAGIAPDVAAEFDAARETAAVAVLEFAERLQARQTRPDFAIGSELYRRMLEVGEGVNTPLGRRAVHRAGQPGAEPAAAGRGGGPIFVPDRRSGQVGAGGRGDGQRQPSHRRGADTGYAELCWRTFGRR